jgi:hypothetical protein
MTHDRKKYSKILKWKSIYEAPHKEIEKRFKMMYGRKPTDVEMDDILLEGEF